MASDLYHEQDAFLIFYETDPVFMAELLAVLTRYHNTPDTEKSRLRRDVEQSYEVEQIGPKAFSDKDTVSPVPVSKLLKLGSALAARSAKQRDSELKALKTRLSRERARRLKILKHWDRHLKACGFQIV